MKIHKSFFLFLFITICFNTFSQNQQVNIDLAEQYYENGETEKAIDIYEELYEKNPSDFFYERLLESFIKVEEYKKAEKLVKRNSKNRPERLDYIVDLGYLEDLQGNRRSAEKQFMEAIDNLSANNQSIAVLANAFIEIGEYDFAERSYLEGRKLLKNNQFFTFELARLYSQSGELDKMLDEYLDILTVNRAYIQSVQNMLQTFLNPDTDGKMRDKLRQKLLRKIQEHPNEDVFPELLIWLFIQNQDFNGALIQAQALDKRKGENGQRLFSLAKLSTANHHYDVAEKSYRYIIQKGEQNPYYLSARMELVRVMKEKIISGASYTNEDLNQLESEYIKTIAELGKSSFTFPLIMDLSRLQAYYLNKAQKAIENLQKLIDMPGIKPMDQADAKILLGDVMLITGEIWESSLLYSQVEKSFKYDEPGERAKFKNAKVAFYTGDFKWAQAQLDVLKGSTSKLISNDAMYLSLLITDNTGLDSITEPLEMFAEADLMLIQNKDSLAISILDSIESSYPATSLKDDILFKKYQIAKKGRNFELAAQHLEELSLKYSTDILGDDAIFHLAELYDNQLNDKDRAQELYKRLLFEFPASLYVVEARKRFRALRGDKPDRLENETIILN